jgi:ABC-type amino acid transport substrate-binding protein
LENILLLTEEYPPYNFVDSQGRLQGKSVLLLERAFSKAGIKLHRPLIRVQPWPRSYRQVQTGHNILLFAMTRTPAREQLFKWAGPISQTKVVLLARKDRNLKISSIDQLNNYVIGGIQNDIGTLLVKDLLNNKANIHIISHAASLAKLLDRKRIDLWAYEENAANHFFIRNNLNPQDFESVYTLSVSELYYAFSLNTDQKIVDRLQGALDSLNELTSP